jgi:hypothetical protein
MEGPQGREDRVYYSLVVRFSILCWRFPAFGLVYAISFLDKPILTGISEAYTAYVCDGVYGGRLVWDSGFIMGCVLAGI